MGDYLNYIIDNCSLEEIKQGYYLDSAKDIYICLCCGEVFEINKIYQIEGAAYTAKGMVIYHIKNKHTSVFDFLINLDKRYNGLSSRQREIFKGFYKYNDTTSRVENLNISPTTVRIYKFKNAEKMRQCKIYLALHDLLEENTVDERAFNFDSDTFIKQLSEDNSDENSSDIIASKNPLLHNKRLNSK